MSWAVVREALKNAVVPETTQSFSGSLPADKVAPGAVLLVGRDGEIVFHEAFGCSSLLPKVSAVSPDTVYDVASLTKAVISTTLIMQAVERGKLELDRKVSSIVQGFGTLGKDRITVRHLLAHCSGYPAHKTFYRELYQAEAGGRTGLMQSRGAIELVRNEIFRSALEHMPGKVTNYSDVGFLLLGAVIESIYGGQTLDKLTIDKIVAPLKLSNLGFIDLKLLKRRGLEPVTEMIAPTAQCPWRKKILCGEVHDDNAWAMGGVAAHAGIFSNARDLHSFAATMLRCYHGEDSFVDSQVVKEFWTKDTTVAESSWALGWDTPSATGSSAGKYFSKSSVGHLGFTGCSMWLDPERNIDVILLTNRIHPSPEANGIKAFRPKLHDLVMEALGVA